MGLTKTVALETSTDPITCNTICPGWVRTAIIEAQIEARASLESRSIDEVIPDFLAEKQPSLAFVDPANLGALALFLCSRAADQITGTSIPVDGGWTAR